MGGETISGNGTDTFMAVCDDKSTESHVPHILMMSKWRLGLNKESFVCLFTSVGHFIVWQNMSQF